MPVPSGQCKGQCLVCQQGRRGLGADKAALSLKPAHCYQRISPTLVPSGKRSKGLACPSFRQVM